MIRTAPAYLAGHAADTVIGREVTIGHQASLHGCTVGDRALVGMGATLLEGSVVRTLCTLLAVGCHPMHACRRSGVHPCCAAWSCNAWAASACFMLQRVKAAVRCCCCAGQPPMLLRPPPFCRWSRARWWPLAPWWRPARWCAAARSGAVSYCCGGMMASPLLGAVHTALLLLSAV